MESRKFIETKYDGIEITLCPISWDIFSYNETDENYANMHPKASPKNDKSYKLLISINISSAIIIVSPALMI